MPANTELDISCAWPKCHFNSGLACTHHWHTFWQPPDWPSEYGLDGVNIVGCCLCGAENGPAILSSW